MTGPVPHWPDSTSAVSELRLSFRVRPGGLLSGLRSPRTVHLDIVDYPGEWLLDLALLETDYTRWSGPRRSPGSKAARWRRSFSQPPRPPTLRPISKRPEPRRWRRRFTSYLQAARAAGYSDCTPGRFLLPGEMEG